MTARTRIHFRRQLGRPPSRTRRAAGWSLLALTLLTAGAFADEPLPVDDERPRSRVPEAKPPEPQAGEAEQQVIRSLNPDDPAALAIARLERAIEKMRDAGRRIQDDEIGKSTQAVQDEVVRDLEKLLELLRLQQQARQSGAPGQPDAKQSPDRKKNRSPGKAGAQAEPRNSESPGPSPASRDRSANRENEKARESEELRQQAKLPSAEESRRQQIAKDVWGHLPPQIRDALQNSFSEKYLPKYDELVKRYYEALAEKDRQRSPAGRQGF